MVPAGLRFGERNPELSTEAARPLRSSTDGSRSSRLTERLVLSLLDRLLSALADLLRSSRLLRGGRLASLLSERRGLFSRLDERFRSRLSDRFLSSVGVFEYARFEILSRECRPLERVLEDFTRDMADAERFRLLLERDRDGRCEALRERERDERVRERERLA